MTATSAVLQGRAAAESLMVDTCTIRRGVVRTFDQATSSYVATGGTVVYTGPCRVRPRDNADRVIDAPGEQVTLVPFVVSVPVTDVGFEVDDEVTITASQLDPALSGAVMRVRQPVVGSQLTARRLGCELDAG